MPQDHTDRSAAHRADAARKAALRRAAAKRGGAGRTHAGRQRTPSRGVETPARPQMRPEQRRGVEEEPGADLKAPAEESQAPAKERPAGDVPPLPAPPTADAEEKADEATAATHVPPLPAPPAVAGAAEPVRAAVGTTAEVAPLPDPPIPAEPPATADAAASAVTVRMDRSRLPGGSATAEEQATPKTPPVATAEEELPAAQIVAEAAEAAEAETVEPVAAEPAAEPADPRDRPWLRAYPPGVPESYRYPLVPLTRLLDDAAQDFPETTAVQFGGTTLTYRQLLEKVDRFATALTGLGIGRGDRMAVALPNCPQAVIALEALWRLGATAVLVDPAAAPEQVTAALRASSPRVALIDEQVYPVLAEGREDLPGLEHVIVTSPHSWLPLLKAKVQGLRARRGGAAAEIPESSGVRRFDDVLEAAPPTATQAEVDAERDVAVILSTPEWPAGVQLTHLNLVANAFQLRLWVPDVQAGREVVLGVVPLHLAFGLTAVLGLGILSALTLVLQDRFDAESAAKAVAAHKVSLLPCAAEEVAPLSAAAAKVDLQSLRVILVGPGEFDEDAAGSLERAARARLRTTFGIPEATALTHASPVYGDAPSYGIGLPLPDTDCRLADRSDPAVDVPAGAAGELLVRGPQVAAGRLGEDGGLLVDGWLRTGVIVRMDPRGHFEPVPSAHHGSAAVDASGPNPSTSEPSVGARTAVGSGA